MNIKSKTLLIFLLSLSILSCLSAKQNHQILNQPAALQHALELKARGQLKLKENGFVYLDVDNSFIDEIVPLLDHEGLIRKLPTSSKSMGAHISVFHESENVTPFELSQEFSFYVTDVRNFTLHTRDGLKKLWVLAADSTDLETLRQSYGKAPLLQGNAFHITLGKQVPSAPEGWQEREDWSQLNDDDSAVQGLNEIGDFVTVDAPSILETAAKVDQVGQLCLKGNGFSYLNVDNELIERVAPLLPTDGNFSPISTQQRGMGAHVSAIHEDEMIKHEIWNLREAGEWFAFEVKELRYVDRKTPQGIQRLWILAVDAPGLQRLRTKYGLKPKLKGYDFHITLGYEDIAAKAEAA